MSSSKEDLVSSLRELLTKNGIHNARVNVEILPPARINENGVSLQRSELTISIQEKNESEMPLITDEPVRQLLDSKPRIPLQKPYVIQEQSEFSTQKRTVTTAGLPGMEKINNVEEHQEDNEIKEEGEAALLSETARPSHEFDQPLTTTAPSSQVEKKNTYVPLKPPQESNGKDDHMYEMRKSGDKGIAQSQQQQSKQPQSQIVHPHPPEVQRNTRSSRSSITPGTPCSRTGSVVHVEENRKNSQERPSPGSVLNPETGLSAHNTEPTESNERSISISNSRKDSTVQLLESPRVREQKHQSFLGDNGGTTSQPGILLSSTSLKMSQTETTPRGSQSDGLSLKLPPVNERRYSEATPVKSNNIANKRSSYSSSNVASSDKQNKTSTPSTETPRMNSKQRLHEMLEEQRRLEQMSAQSRARHEELLQEAEKYLQELQQEATGSTATAATGSPAARIEFRTARSASPRGTSTPDSFSSAAPRSPSSHTLGGSIKVVKFTLPQGGKAKDEAVTQLSSSPGGAQHVSSKDKFSTLLREQEKMLRANNASEQEYQKLLEQAIEYHKQQKYIKEMEKEHGENMRELEEGAYQ